MRVVRAVAAAVCGAGWVVPVAAAPTITEAEFLERVTAAHPARREIGAELAAAEAERRRAGLLANPEVSFDREHPTGGPRQDTWSVRWTPPLPGEHRLRRKAAAAGLRAEQLRSDAERLRVRQDARRVYAAWSVAVARSALLARQSEQLQRLADKARLRADSGEESGLSARRLRLAATEVRAELASADAARARMEADAGAWYGEPMTGTVPALPNLPEAGTPPLDHRPLDLQAIEADLDQARLTRRAQSHFWDAPELMVGRQALSDVGPTRTGTVWGVSWSVPLFDRAQPERLLAKRRAEIAEPRLQLAARRLPGQVAAASDAYRALLEGVRAIEADVRDPSAIVEAAVASYRAGESSVTDLIDTLDGVRSASLRWLELYAEAHAAHRAVELGLGQAEGEGR